MHDCLGWASGLQCGECFICRMMEIFDEVRRVLREDGVCWVNLGDTYVHQRGSQPSPTGMNKNAKRPGGCPVPEGVKPKDLALIPQRFALAAQARGWWVRSDVIWRKTAPMPCGSSDRPRPTHEYIWLLTKNSHYAFDMDAVRLPLSPKTLTTHGTSHRPQGGGEMVKAHRWANTNQTRQPRTDADGNPAGAPLTTVWDIYPKGSAPGHFATFPTRLVEPMIKSGCPVGGVVLDPFMGSGTVAVVAKRLNRRFVGIELNPEYVALAERRVAAECGLLMCI